MGSPLPRLLQISAKDADFGDFGSVTYDITSDMAKEVFAIDGDTGQIMTKVRLDRELKPVSGWEVKNVIRFLFNYGNFSFSHAKLYEVPVIATDGGGRSGFATLKVHVGDENDNAPLFLHCEYKAVIYSNATTDLQFMRLQATDSDADQNAVIRYSIYDAQNAGVLELFRIDERTGGMTLRKSAKNWGKSNDDKNKLQSEWDGMGGGIKMVMSELHPLEWV